MKKDRNYPIYPNYNMPMNYGMMMPIPGPMNSPIPYTMNSTCGNNGSSETNTFQEQLNNLERRVSRLEATVNGKTTSFGSSGYNDSNYHIM